MSQYLSAALDFRKAVGVPCDLDLTEDLDALQLQLGLIKEEIGEFIHALAHEDRSAVIKELTDVAYVIFQFAAAFGIDLDEAYLRVHQNNMAKLVGGIIRGPDGKVLKREDHPKPDMSDL